MQRLFSTFPGGRPGAGLLVLRLMVVSPLVADGLAIVRAEPGAWWVTAWGLLAVACGVLLIAGLLTPVSSVLAGAVTGGLAIGMPTGAVPLLLQATPTAGLVIAVTVATFLLGPGAFSVDAVLFGRREIVIPHE